MVEGNGFACWNEWWSKVLIGLFELESEGRFKRESYTLRDLSTILQDEKRIDVGYSSMRRFFTTLKEAKVLVANGITIKRGKPEQGYVFSGRKCRKWMHTEHEKTATFQLQVEKIYSYIQK